MNHWKKYMNKINNKFIFQIKKYIINIYNSCDKSLIDELHEYLRNNINIHDYNIIIMKDNFNTHHSIWNPEKYIRHDKKMNALMNMIIELELKLLLPSRITIYSNVDIIIDLIWEFNEAANRMITCQIAKEHDHDSDHLSIEIIIVMSIKESQYHLSYNYAKIN